MVRGREDQQTVFPVILWAVIGAVGSGWGRRIHRGAQAGSHRRIQVANRLWKKSSSHRVT